MMPPVEAATSPALRLMLCVLGSSQAACWALLTAGVMPQVDRGALSSEDEATEMAGGTRVLRTAGQGAVHSRLARLGGAAGKLGYGQAAWGNARPPAGAWAFGAPLRTAPAAATVHAPHPSSRRVAANQCQPRVFSCRRLTLPRRMCS